MFEWMCCASWAYVPVVSVPVLAFLYYQHMTKHYAIFEQMGVKGPKPSIWTMGNAYRFFTSKSLTQFYIDLFEEYGSISGSFSGRLAMLNVSDPDMLKQILIKDFDGFRDHYILNMKDYGLRRTLSQIKGDDWRSVRAQMTPAFSSRRLRQMASHLNICGAKMVVHLDEKSQAGFPFDVRKHVQAFMMDSIAGIGFGIDVDSLKDSESAFVKHADLGINTFSLKSFPMYVLTILPFLMDLMQRIGVTIIPTKAIKYFANLVDQVMKSRQSGSDLSKSDDILQLLVNSELEDTDNDLMDANDNSQDFMRETKGKRKGLTHEEIVGAGLTFFLAGNDTSTTTVTCLCYNLACNPDVQDKVIAEIDEVMQGHDEPNYDLVTKMKYLDMCLEETLRMYPLVMRLDRMCNKTTTINGITIPKDLMVMIPICAIHYNPEVYPEPEKFIPERFTPEQKALRSPYSWLPFGAGPRMCIGQRLAMMEMKMMMVHMLRRYRLCTCPQTPIPLEIDEFGMLTKIKGSIFLAVEAR